MMHLLELLGSNRLVRTSIQPVIPSITKYFCSAKTQISMETFCKRKDEVNGGFNKNNWLAVDVSKVGQGSAKKVCW